MSDTEKSRESKRLVGLGSLEFKEGDNDNQNKKRKQS